MLPTIHKKSLKARIANYLDKSAAWLNAPDAGASSDEGVEHSKYRPRNVTPVSFPQSWKTRERAGVYYSGMESR